MSPSRIPLPLAAAAIAVLAGCSPAAAPAATAPGPETVEVDNCGTVVAFPAAPERVVTIKSTSTEMLLALGVGDRIVGTAFQDGPLPADLAEAGGDLPVLADRVPSEEAVLAVEPDLVYAGWESNLTAEGAGERDELLALGVASYVSPAACKAPGYRPEKLTWDAVFAEIREVGAIFRAEDAAEELIAEQQNQLDDVAADPRGLDALWYSSGTETPYVGAGIGAPQLILDTVGLANIAADVEDSWSPLGWESVVAADPDVIVVVDAAWNTAEDKIALLRSDPALAALTAVREDRFLVVPFAASEAGVRSAPAAADLARQLAELP
ncbi:MAG: putative transporter, periplasmic binding protein [Mycetocola sp.]|nr:putative transporter, periplasmic binding protein [Mycetocola sp.]